MRRALNVKPYAGNPHVWFDEGEVAPSAKPRRGSLLYTTEKALERFTGVKRLAISLFAGLALANAAFADTPDAFVEYVESDGSQYIDTGVIGRCGTSADMTIQWLSTGDASFLSSRIDSNNTRFILLSNQGGTEKHYYMAHGGYQKTRDTSISTYSTSAPDRIESSITHDGTSVTYTMRVNGTEEINQVREEAALDTGRSMYLFAQNQAGSAVLKSKVRCYSVKIWQNGNLMRDFKPCVKDGVAGIYDNVSKEIFYPAGGTLAAGPVVKSHGKPDHIVQYVESSGTQYIDTEVIGKCNTSADMTIQWLSVNVDGAFLGSRISASGTDEHTRFVLCSNDANGRYYTCHRTYSYASDKDKAQCDTTKPDHLYSSIAHDGTTMMLLQRVNGVTVQNANRTENALDTGLNMYLFAQNLGGTAQLKSSVRFFGTKIWQDGNLVRDFRPCVKDGRAGLYDEVSGWMFFPQGGELVYPNGKPDKIMKWVNLTGSSYVDTQVRAKSGVRSEMQYRPSVDDLEDQYMLAARTNNVRFLLGYYYNPTVGNLEKNRAAIGYKGKWNVVEWSSHVIDKTHTLVSEISANGTVSGTCNGIAKNDSTEYGAFDTGLNLYMFGINMDGKAQDFFNGRSYYSKIWVWDETANDYALVRDFVPCVKDEEVAFFDNVSQTIFRPYPAIPAANNAQPRQGLIISIH